MIAFVGSVFSPYYALARRLQGDAVDPEHFCAINVALYGRGARRWTMTERGRQQVQREARRFQVGPSHLHWDGERLHIDVDELNVPIPKRVRGRISVTPHGLCDFVTPLDHLGRHRWGPIAPCARVEVRMAQPELHWQGHGYLDSNEGDEPVEQGFQDWDWARAEMANGDTFVIYDVRPQQGPSRVVAQRFTPQGGHEAFESPPRHDLSHSGWRIARAVASADEPARLLQTLEDTPFYARSLVDATWLGERVTAVHESLSIPRLVSLPVRLMLPWRMPRRP